jgi:prepilin-type N-terminal cleavage/methylation domain-containing protein
LRSERGFTLIEMLVALLIGAIIVSQLYILTRAISHDTTKQQMETEAMQRARIGIEMLTADFQRAGMMASPNPARDADSMVTQGADSDSNELNQHAYYRPAIVHLNRGPDREAWDSVLLVGSFVTSNTYQAYLTLAEGGGQSEISIVPTFATAADCETEFNKNYAFVHLFAPNGQATDARVGSATCSGATDCECTITLAEGELFVDGPSAFADGQMIRVAANQAALYFVQPMGGRNALVRYFVDFDGATSLETGCSLADFYTRDSGGGPGEFNVGVDKTSAKIIADYVTDFQVWFRNVYKNEPDEAMGSAPVNHEWGKPRYYDMTSVGAERLLPCDDAELFDSTSGATSAGCAPKESYLGCKVIPGDGNLGPEHVRSAVIRLGVRTERTDQEVMKLIPADEWDAIESKDQSNDGNRIVRYNVARPPAGDVGAYKVRTVVTEVSMPNIAARMASFKRITEF